MFIVSATDSPVQPITERTLAYALRAIALTRHLLERKDPAAGIPARQYLRASTSVGANVEEAQAAESKADFIHKLSIAQKEARESLYWLRLLQMSTLVSGRRLELLVDETRQIVAVISKIVATSKLRRNGKAQ